MNPSKQLKQKSLIKSNPKQTNAAAEQFRGSVSSSIVDLQLFFQQLDSGDDGINTLSSHRVGTLLNVFDFLF